MNYCFLFGFSSKLSLVLTRLRIHIQRVIVLLALARWLPSVWTADLSRRNKRVIETGGVAPPVGCVRGGWVGAGGLRLTSATFPSGGGGPHTLAKHADFVSSHGISRLGYGDWSCSSPYTFVLTRLLINTHVTELTLTHLTAILTKSYRISETKKNDTHVMQTQTTLTQMRLNMRPRPRQTPQGSTAVRRVTVWWHRWHEQRTTGNSMWHMWQMTRTASCQYMGCARHRRAISKHQRSPFLIWDGT